jgi:hypothetical protein
MPLASWRPNPSWERFAQVRGNPADCPPLPLHHLAELREYAGGGWHRGWSGRLRVPEPAVRGLHPRFVRPCLHRELGPAVAGRVQALIRDGRGKPPWKGPDSASRMTVDTWCRGRLRACRLRTFSAGRRTNPRRKSWRCTRGGFGCDRSRAQSRVHKSNRSLSITEASSNSKTSTP